MSILTQEQRNMSNLHNQIRYFDNNPLIPSDLRITINTGVPGFQSIIYKPQMSIPDTKEKKIWFTPLIRLNQRIVDKVPPEYIIKQFFNKGLYESLLRYHGIVPIKKEDNELENAEKGAARRVIVAEEKVEKALRRVKAANDVLSPLMKDDEHEHDMMVGGMFENMDRDVFDEYYRRKQADFKKYLTHDEYKEYINNHKNYIKKERHYDDFKDKEGKIHEGSYKKEARFEKLMETRRKDDKKKKLADETASDKVARLATLEKYKKEQEKTRLAYEKEKAKRKADFQARFEATRKAVQKANYSKMTPEEKKVADEKAAEEKKVASDIKKAADKKDADEKAADKNAAEFSEANASLASAQIELQQKESDKKASDNNLRRIKADKAEPDKIKTESKDAAIWALKEAKIRGNFNNNIKVTMDTLFKNGNVLYIDKKPYVIVDTQMIQGDWSLDVKPAEMATIYHTSQNVVYDKAEQSRRVELETAGLTSFAGENWVERYPDFNKKYSRTTLKPQGQVTPYTRPKITNQPEDVNSQYKIIPPVKRIEEQKKRRPTLDETLIPRLNQGLSQKEKYETSIKKYFGIHSNKLRGLGLKFYNNINILLTETNKRNPAEIGNRVESDFTRYSTRTGSNVKPREFTPNHYIDVIQSINVYENIAGGHCFFDAIAQALNLYNVYETSKQILSSNKCVGSQKVYELFDQECIRKVVIDTMIDYLNIIRDEEEYNKKNRDEQKDLDSRLTSILNEFKSKIIIDDFKKFKTDLRHTTIDDLKKTIETEIPKSGYLGSEHTMKFFTLGSQKYIGMHLNIVVIREASMGNTYEIHEEFRDIKPGQRVIFLLNVNQGQHMGVNTSETEGYQNHYVLLTFKEIKTGIDRSIFTLDQIPFVFWCYIILFTIVHDKLFTQSILDESEKFLLTKNFTNDIVITHNSLLVSNKPYREFICDFFKKTDGPCDPNNYLIDDVRKGRKKSSKKVRPPVTPRMSSRNKLADSSRDIDESNVESNVESTDNDSDVNDSNKEGGSSYYQYGGEGNQVEKHREDYQNNYARYPGIPIAYPVTRVEEIDKSISSVFVTIDLELHKGKTISNSELASSKCNHQYNAIKHSFAVLTGTPYIIAPVYGGTRRNKHVTKKQTHRKRQRVRNVSRKRRRNKTHKRC